MHKYEAVYRLDQEEYFCTDTQDFELDTTDLAEAAQQIQKELGPNVTLIELKRVT